MALLQIGRRRGSDIWWLLVLLTSAVAAVPLTYNATTTRAYSPNLHGCLTAQALALPYCDTSLSRDERLDDLVSHFSSSNDNNLTELLQQITPQADLFGAGICATVTRGLERIGLPPWFWLVETNTQANSACIAPGSCATTFVGPLGMAASFNRTLWRFKGQVLGRELRALNNLHGSRYHLPPDPSAVYSPVALTGFGPNINIARDPRFGRTSELPGEDPLLSGEYAKHMVTGMQTKSSNGVPLMAAFLKHFTAYSTETDRGHDTYNISALDFWDTYLPQYQRAFEAMPFGVMCSYNAENGVPSCANDWLLNQVLRKWSPDALVTTDCGAVVNLMGKPVQAPSHEHAAAYALMNGTDLEMGTTLFQDNLQRAVELGLATRDRIRQAVRRSFHVHFELGRFDPPSLNKWTTLGKETLNHTRHQQISYEAALQSFVLLNNTHHALPLTRGNTIAVVGPQAVSKSGLFSDYAGDQRCYNGGYDCMQTIAQAISDVNVGGITRIAKGVDLNSNRTDGIVKALDMAKDADAIVVVVGNDRSEEAEGKDRTDTALVGLQESFVHQILALGRPTILILTNGGPLAIDHLLRAPVPEQPYAIVDAFNPAVLGPPALAATLFGIHNKWGKMPVTMYPHDYIQQQSMINYDMSKYPGRTYKYYQGTPLFGFGHGLSLTTFEFDCKPLYKDNNGVYKEQQRNKDMTKKQQLRQQLAMTMTMPLSLTCTVSNTGDRRGDEVLLLYHRAANVGAVAHPLPRRALRDFVRLSDISPGDSAVATFDLSNPMDILAVVNQEGKRVVYPGDHQLIVSRSPHLEEQVLEIAISATEIY